MGGYPFGMKYFKANNHKASLYIIELQCFMPNGFHMGPPPPCKGHTQKDYKIN